MSAPVLSGQAHIRFARQVEHLHSLGPRSVGELLLELAEATGSTAIILAQLARYEAVDPAIVPRGWRRVLSPPAAARSARRSDGSDGMSGIYVSDYALRTMCDRFAASGDPKLPLFVAAAQGHIALAWVVRPDAEWPISAVEAVQRPVVFLIGDDPWPEGRSLGPTGGSHPAAPSRGGMH